MVVYHTPQCNSPISLLLLSLALNLLISRVGPLTRAQKVNKKEQAKKIYGKTVCNVANFQCAAASAAMALWQNGKNPFMGSTVSVCSARAILHIIWFQIFNPVNIHISQYTWAKATVATSYGIHTYLPIHLRFRNNGWCSHMWGEQCHTHACVACVFLFIDRV